MSARRITIEDCRRAGHCARGIRAWFERHGFDFREFLRNGIDEQAFLATGDGHAQQVVARKREREATG